MEQHSKATPAYWRLYAARTRESAATMRTAVARQGLERIAATADAMAESMERLNQSRVALVKSLGCRDEASDKPAREDKPL